MATDSTAPPRADFSLDLPVRWSDCDPAQVIFYPNYFAYFEQTMYEFVRARGSSWSELIYQHGLHFPRIEAQARYFAPASFDDTIRVEVRVQEIARKVLTIGWLMRRRRDDRVIAEGHVKFAAIRADVAPGEDSRAIELPEVVTRLFARSNTAD